MLGSASCNVQYYVKELNEILTFQFSTYGHNVQYYFNDMIIFYGVKWIFRSNIPLFCKFFFSYIYFHIQISYITNQSIENGRPVIWTITKSNWTHIRNVIFILYWYKGKEVQLQIYVFMLFVQILFKCIFALYRWKLLFFLNVFIFYICINYILEM